MEEIKSLRHRVLISRGMKFELIKVDGKSLYRIRALRDFGQVRKGDLGGWIQSEFNLYKTFFEWAASLPLVAEEKK